MANEPIEELNYLAGLKVVNIGDIRVARGMTRRPVSVCNHRQLAYDPHERRIWCKDCETDVDPFDAFVSLAEQFNSAITALAARETRVAEAETFQLRSLAAKAIDQAWRSHTMVPACPSCGAGLFPEDFKNGTHTVLGRDYAMARRNAKPRI